MIPSSPFQIPSTPSSFRSLLQYRPLNSSPLAESQSSPIVAAQARRRSQYKSLSPMTPFSVRVSSEGRQMSRRTASEGTKRQLDPRDKYRQKCIERAVKERQRAIQGRRSKVPQDPNSDDYAMEGYESDDDDAIIGDEFYKRIVLHSVHKMKHEYNVSYAREMGSSFDPAFEDVDNWEEELAGDSSYAHPRSLSGLNAVAGPSTPRTMPASVSTPRQMSYSRPETEEDEIPLEFDDEELEAYAQEYAQNHQDSEFEDLPEDFDWSEFEELNPSIEDSTTPTPTPKTQQSGQMDDMDTS